MRGADPVVLHAVLRLQGPHVVAPPLAMRYEQQADDTRHCGPAPRPARSLRPQGPAPTPPSSSCGPSGPLVIVKHLGLWSSLSVWASGHR